VSKFTQCNFDLLAQKVVVHHLDESLKYRNLHKGQHHVCRIVGGHCKCCDCLPEGYNLGPPSNIRTVLVGQYRGTEPYLLGGGASNRQRSELACQQQCAEMHNCKVGTYITAGDGDGECWLSENVLAQPSMCTMPCTSFEKFKKELSL
jgi:hypothetical protein